MTNTGSLSLLVMAVFIGTSTKAENGWVENEIGVYSLVQLDQPERLAINILLTEKDLREKVLFHLYTPSNPDIPQQLHIEDVETLRGSSFNATLPTRIVIHGWKNGLRSDMNVFIRQAYLKAGNYNVIVVDWEALSNGLYLVTYSHVWIMGRFVAQMIDFMEERGMDLNDLTIVGHSLGAHIAGISARNAIGTVGYVVGLDPALPFFSQATAGSRIGKGDAHYVQIIHTSASLLGFRDAIGDVDFYPNGGLRQPGCGLDLLGSCAHGRAYLYFAESITTTTGFTGHSCPNYRLYRTGKCDSKSTVKMGGVSPTTRASGTYYLKTNNAPPYAQG